MGGLHSFLHGALVRVYSREAFTSLHELTNSLRRDNELPESHFTRSSSQDVNTSRNFGFKVSSMREYSEGLPVLDF